MVLIIFNFMNSLVTGVLCVFPKRLVYTRKLTWINAAHDCKVTHVFEKLSMSLTSEEAL